MVIDAIGGGAAATGRQAGLDLEMSIGALRPAAAAGGSDAADRAGKAADFSRVLDARAADKAETPRQDALKKLEASLLTTLVEAMLPKDDGEAYGGGFGAQMWKSMAAEQYAGVLAERGDIGLARMLDGSFGPGGTAAGEVGFGNTKIGERTMKDQPK